MRSLVAPTYCKPAGYEIQDVAMPTIQGPHDILVRVHAASINTADTAMAAGQMKMLVPKNEYVILPNQLLAPFLL